VKAAQHYLAEYFKLAEMALCWGSAEDFLNQLQERIDAAGPEEEPAAVSAGETYD
jgi:hypothetical protein